MKDIQLLLGLAFVSGVMVSAGLFMQVRAIVGQRRSLTGMLLKLGGLIPLFFAVSQGREQWLTVILTFFVSAVIFLVFLTLARNRLLR